MAISQLQLKQIIKEELNKTLVSEGFFSNITDRFSKKPEEKKPALDDFEAALNKVKGVNKNWTKDEKNEGSWAYKGSASTHPYIDIFIKFDKVSKDAYKVSGYVSNNKYPSNRTSILVPNPTYTKEELKSGELTDQLTSDIKLAIEKHK